MIKSTLAALALTTVALTNAADAQWNAELLNTGELAISSGFINTTETITVSIDAPPFGRKGRTEVVVEHSPSQQTERFWLRTKFVNGQIVYNISHIAFVGDADADNFINDTDIPCFALGLGGNDFLQGGSKGDMLDGGDGNDTLIGGNGRDDLFGRDGFDHLFGENGRDLLVPGDDDNEGQIVGGAGADTFEIFGGQQFQFYDFNAAEGDVEDIQF